MQETAQLRQQAAKLVGERLALAQEGNFAELLRRDELEANELGARLAKPEQADGADDEEEGAQKAAAAAVNLVQKESLTRATKRLTSHGIASLGPEEETKKSQRASGTGGTPATPIKRMEGKRQKQSDRTGLPHVHGKDQRRGTGRGSGCIWHSV